MPRVLELPVAATPMREVGVPGNEAGLKMTVPSTAETAEEELEARSWEEPQRPCGEQGGAQA
jgi:hypothetical protein